MIQKNIIFMLDDQLYGLPIQSIERIISAVEITPLPKADKHLLGIISIHGTISPVINIRNFLNLPAKPLVLTDEFIEINIHSHKILFIVDKIVKVLSIKEDPMDKTNPMMDSKNEYIKKIIQDQNQYVFMLNMENILSNHYLLSVMAIVEQGNKVS